MSGPIENLVFEAGGMKAIAYAGALTALAEQDLLEGVERTAGTSAGALMAMMVALRYTPREIRDTLWHSDFSTFNDHPDPLRVATRYGLYKGDAFHDWIRKRLEQQGFDSRATFADLEERHCRDLHVFAADLNTRGVREFSLATTPHARVADAVRASMTIPLMYTAWQFEDGYPNDHLYVDGGIVMGYPIRTFDDHGPNHATLGFHLSHVQADDGELGYNHLFRFVPHLFEVLLRSQVVQLEHAPETLARTVVIEDFGISAVDFQLDESRLQQLFDSGYESTREHLAERS